MAKAKVKASTIKVPVQERALIARINRRLRDENEGHVLKIARSAAMERLHGHYYIFDTRRNLILGYSPDTSLEAFAREYECIQPWEVLEKEE